jgi:hypothetical protein
MQMPKADRRTLSRISVIFADLVGSSTLGESPDAEALAMSLAAISSQCERGRTAQGTVE